MFFSASAPFLMCIMPQIDPLWHKYDIKWFHLNPAVLYMHHHAGSVGEDQSGCFTPLPTQNLGRCFEKHHQQLCHHSHHLLVVGGWGFVGYWFSPSRDGFHNWLKWPGAERDGSLLKTISQPCLELSQARGCSDAFQPQPDWQQLGVSEPSSACAPHKHP